MSKIQRLYHFESRSVIRKLVLDIITGHPGMELAGSTGNVKELMQILRKEQTDTLLVGFGIHDTLEGETGNGLAICRYTAEKHPTTKTVAHSTYATAINVSAIMIAGASGFVSKLAQHTELIIAINEVAHGRKYVCKQTGLTLDNEAEFLNGTAKHLIHLDKVFTPRERDVLSLLGMGLSSREIANELYISEKTVETHRKNLIEKSLVKNTAQLIAFSTMHGIM